MTAPTLGASPAGAVPPRPGSRAARMALPMAKHVVREMAEQYGVCVRPIAMRRTDLTTGRTEVIDLPCGATREDKCPSCARRARRLRQVQIREGWHRTDEPIPGPEPATDEQRALIILRAHFEFERADAERNARWDQVDDLDQAIIEVEQAIAAQGLRGRVAPPHGSLVDDQDDAHSPRRVRSTKRRQDVADLPRRPVERRTVGRVYTAPDGKAYRPSMFLTLTLDSYGRVHTDDGTPVNPGSYDYRRAAWDAVHFPRLLDRFWQNLRRAEGWNIQYAGCVEPQRRLAPHAHFAVRGTIPRAVVRQVAAATYHQVWWPNADELLYSPDRPPVWDSTLDTWTDPTTGLPLTTWDEALDDLDAQDEPEPAHVVRFGSQIDAKGVLAGTEDAERTVRYVTKYLTKAAADCHTMTTDRQRAHLERLWQQLRITPCSERCANWLLYGIQPKKAHGKLRPGNCKGRVHQRATLGIGGRRVLISRDWSGKTLDDHRADAHAWVKAVLGVTVDLDHAASADQSGSQYAWEMAGLHDPDVPALEHRLLRAISERAQQRAALDAARQRASDRPPGAPPTDVSATDHTTTTDGEDE